MSLSQELIDNLNEASIDDIIAVLDLDEDASLDDLPILDLSYLGVSEDNY